MTDRGRLVRAIAVTVVTAAILMIIAAHFTWDVLQSKNPDLFYRVNALQLESEVDGVVHDPVAITSVVLFNVVVFGVPGFVGAQLYPRLWWAAPAALAAVGVALWFHGFATLFLQADRVEARLASLIDLVSMVGSALGGARIGWRRPQREAHAG